MIHEIALNGYTAVCEDCGSVLYLGTEDSYGLEQLRVIPDESWAGLTITAVFTNGSSTEVPAVNDLIDVPPEACAQATGSGLGRIVFKGIQDGVQRISTDLFYVVSGHGPTDGENALVPTADQYAQFVAAVKADADRAEAAAERAESAEGVFTQADLEQAVAGYLEENPVEAAPIDTTLTQSGQAADAKAVGDAIANIELTPGPQGEKGKDGAAGADGLSMYTVSAEPEMESDTGGTVDPGLIDTGGRTLTAGDLLLSPGGKVYRVLQAADTVICSVSFFADLHGSDGLTPVKGTDYWTEADKAELVDAVLAALPAAEEVSF